MLFQICMALSSIGNTKVDILKNAGNQIIS